MICWKSLAATGPNPPAGRPRQGPGALRRDPPMAGTWAPVERGVTATSSKCPVFRETEGELSAVPDVSDALPTCDYSSHVTASTLSPSVHSEYWFSVPSTAAHTLPLPPSHSLSHSHAPTALLMPPRKTQGEGFGECARCGCCCRWWRNSPARGLCFLIRESAHHSEDAGL